MTIHYKDLRPKKSQAEINGKVYKLKPFSLAIEVWAYHEFATEKEENGVHVLAKHLEDVRNIETIGKLFHKLLYDKTDFPTYKNVVKVLSKKNQQAFINIYNALVECIGISQPMIDEAEEELKKSLAEARMLVLQNSTTRSPLDMVGT